MLIEYRYYVTKNPTYMISYKKFVIFILFWFSLALFWSIVPLFGWSHYSLEGALTSCSVEWVEKSNNVTSYNVILFIFGYIMPISIIIYSNIEVLKIVFCLQI